MSPPINLLFLLNSYHPEYGGGTMHCRRIAKGLVETGRFRVTVLAGFKDKNLPGQADDDGIKAWRILPHVSSSSRRKIMAANGQLPWFMFRLRSEYQLVFFNGGSWIQWMGTIWAHLLRKPKVMRLNLLGNDPLGSIRIQGPEAWLKNWCYGSYDRVVAIAPGLSANYMKSGQDPRRLVQITNGVDLQQFIPVSPDEKIAIRHQLNIPIEKVVVCFLGAVVQRKGVDLLAQAWPTVIKRTGAPHLVVVGPAIPDDAAWPTWQAFVKSDSVRRTITIAGETPRPDLYLKAADLLVLPSRNEGLPNAVIEAMACGLPAIVSALPGVSDFVIHDTVDGIILPELTANALTSAISDLVESPRRRTGIGVRARETAERKFSASIEVQNYAALFSSLV